MIEKEDFDILIVYRFCFQSVLMMEPQLSRESL